MNTITIPFKNKDRSIDWKTFPFNTKDEIRDTVNRLIGIGYRFTRIKEVENQQYTFYTEPAQHPRSSESFFEQKEPVEYKKTDLHFDEDKEKLFIRDFDIVTHLHYNDQEEARAILDAVIQYLNSGRYYQYSSMFDLGNIFIPAVSITNNVPLKRIEITSVASGGYYFCNRIVNKYYSDIQSYIKEQLSFRVLSILVTDIKDLDTSTHKD